MAYETLLEEDRNLKFLVQDVPESRDEADSISKYVVNLESASAVYLPKYSLDSENRAVKQETRRLRTVSKELLEKFGRNAHQNGVIALLTFKDKLEDEQVKKLPSLLKSVCDVQMVLYHSSHFAILQMEVKSYTLLGDKILEENGYNIQNMIITHLEALSLDALPNCFIELLTGKSNAVSIQNVLSNALVRFCGSFRYLRLNEGDELDLKASNPPVGFKPSVSLTLLFSKRAQGNAKQFNAILSDDNSTWERYQHPDVVCIPFEQLFLLRNYSAPLVGLIGGNDVPGVRISVMFSTKKEEMTEFYRVLTGRSPICRSDKTGTSYMIYPIAAHLELQLICNESIHTDPSDSIAICIRIKDHEKVSTALGQPLTCIDAGHWETSDPVGNRIKLFVPFE